jgi:hypothetical protein
VVPDRFELDDLLRGIADSESPSMAQQSLVKTPMAIDYLPTATGKVRQLGDRIELLRAFETEVHAGLSAIRSSGEGPCLPSHRRR